MELKTEQRRVDVLWVEVPTTINADVFVELLSTIDDRHLGGRLKHGITVSADQFNELQNSELVEELAEVREFLRAVDMHVIGPRDSFVPDEFCFHRWVE